MHEIELVFKSPALKVLKFLLKNEGYHSKYAISKYSGVSHPEYILDRMIEYGWIKVIEINGFKKYGINMENETIKALKEFLKKIKYI